MSLEPTDPRFVLGVDLDHQAHLTRWTLTTASRDALEVDLLPALLRERPLAELIVRTEWPGVDLAPSSTNLSAVDLILAAATKREDRLRMALEGVQDRYTFAVFDCPPYGGLITLNAVAAADWILVPIEAGNFSLAGLSDFVNWVEAMREDGVHDAQWLGLVPTRYDKRDGISKETLEILRVVSESLGGVAVLPAIPRRTGQEAMVASRTVAPVKGAGRLSELAQAYHYMAEHVFRQLAPPVGVAGLRGRRIAVVNFKGGTGKTTTAGYLCSYLSSMLRERLPASADAQEVEARAVGA